MALTATSLQQRFSATASGAGAWNAAPTRGYGLLDNAAGTATTYDTGDLLRIEATPLGTLDEVSVGNENASNLVGVLDEVTPGFTDMRPLTSGTAPATALARSKTAPAVNDGQDYTTMADVDFGVNYFMLIPGNFFVGHVCNEADDSGNPGTDIRADSDLDILDSVGNTLTIAQASGAASNVRVNYITRAGFHILARVTGAITNTIGRTLHYANPQKTTAIGGTFTNTPDLIVENDDEVRSEEHTSELQSR